MASMSMKQANAVNRAAGWLLGALPKGAIQDLKEMTKSDSLDPADISVLVGDVMDLAYNQGKIEPEEEHRKMMEVLDIINKNRIYN